MAVAWATVGAEGAGPRGGCTPTCQGGGRARPSLHGCVGRQVLQYLTGSSGISPELRVCDGSFSLDGHRPRHSSGATSSLIIDVVVIDILLLHVNWIIRDVIRVILYSNIIVATGLFEMLLSVFAYTKLIMSINILNRFIFLLHQFKKS